MTHFPESGLFLEDPQISRDGHQLLYSHGRITGDIWILNLGKYISDNSASFWPAPSGTVRVSLIPDRP